MKYDFITIGGAIEDITFFTREGILIKNKKNLKKQELLAFEYGAKIKVDKFYYTFGGGAANAAVNLAGLGYKVACLCVIGMDGRGQRIYSNFKKRRVKTNLIQKIKKEETGFSFILVNPEKIVFSNYGVKNRLKIGRYELKNLKKSEWAYVTSLSGKWNDVLKKVFAVDGLKIAWNPGVAQLKKGIKIIGKFIKKTTILFLNKDEAIELILSDPKFRKKPKGYLNNVRNLLFNLKKVGPEIIVITDGKNGAYAYDGKKYYYQKIVKEKRKVDATGVGDAFNSSFVAGLKIYQGGIQKSMLLGARNTASVISKQGAQNGLLKRYEI